MDQGRYMPSRNTPPSADPSAARMVGLAVLATIGVVALGHAAAFVRARRARAPTVAAATRPGETAPQNLGGTRGLHGAAALLATSVLADSALEHYRGSFENPG